MKGTKERKEKSKVRDCVFRRERERERRSSRQEVLKQSEASDKCD